MLYGLKKTTYMRETRKGLYNDRDYENNKQAI